MMWGSKTRLGAIAAAIVYLLAPLFARAQSCVMCYTTVAAAQHATSQALKSGILVLLVPSLVIVGGIGVFVFRSRDTFNEPDPWDYNA